MSTISRFRSRHQTLPLNSGITPPPVPVPLVFLGSIAEASGGFVDNIVQRLVPVAVGAVRVIVTLTDDGSFTAPAGWTIIGDYSETLGNPQSLRIWSRVKQPGDTDANVTLINSGTGVGFGSSYAFEGGSVLTSDTPTADLRATTNAYFTIPSMTVATPASVLFFGVALANSSTDSWDTQTAGWTKLSDLALPGGFDQRHAMFQSNTVLSGVVPSPSVRCGPGNNHLSIGGMMLTDVV